MGESHASSGFVKVSGLVLSSVLRIDTGIFFYLNID